MNSNIIKNKLSLDSQTASNSLNHSPSKNNYNLKKSYNNKIQLSNSKNIDIYEQKTIRDNNSKNSPKSNKTYYLSKSTLTKENPYSNNVTSLRKNNKNKNKNLSLINLTMYDNSFKNNKNNRKIFHSKKNKNKNINIRLVSKYDCIFDNNNINENSNNTLTKKKFKRTNSIESKNIYNNINGTNHKKTRNVKNKEKENKYKKNNTNIEYTKYLRTLSDEQSIKVNKQKKFSGLNISNNFNDNSLNSFIIPDEYKTECIIAIQAYFRKYILKKKLYNNINIYIRYIKANSILNNIFNTMYKFNFINKFKQIYNIKRIYYFQKLEKKLIEYKIYKEQYSDLFEQFKKLENKNYEIIKENNELKKQLKEMKNKKYNFQNNVNEQIYSKKSQKKIENKIITNNFTIQNQVNIIMAKPEDISKNEIKKSIKKQKNKNYNKSKTEVINEDINNGQNIKKKVKFENESIIKEKENLEIQETKEEKEEKDKIKDDKKEIKQNENNIVNNILNNPVKNENEVKKYYFNDNKIENKVIQIEYLQKSINKYKLILLKKIIETKINNSERILQKIFLRYQYNIIYTKKLDENNIKFEKEIEKEEKKIKILEQEIEENKKEIERNKNIEENLDEIRIEYKNKNLYSQEKLNKVKRNKELRELFYNKIRERQNYLHKCFTRFYYKGLMIYMKNKYSNQNSNINYDSNIKEYNSENEVNNKDISTNNNYINNNNNNNSTNINFNNNVIKNNNDYNNNIQENDKNINKNNEINNNNNIVDNTKIDEKAKEEENKISNKYANARKLRRLLIQKGKEKLELLRKYFYKFHQAGILLTLRKGTKRASLFKKMEGIDLETAFKTVVNNQVMNEIDVDENSNVINFQEAIDKKMNDEKFAKDIERQRNEVEEKKRYEKQKNEEINKKKLKALEIIFNKLDRNNKVVFKKKFEIFYLKSKVISLSSFKRSDKRSKTAKGKRKGARRSVVVSSFNIDNTMLDQINKIKRSNSGDKKKDTQLENEIEPIFGEEVE